MSFNSTPDKTTKYIRSLIKNEDTAILSEMREYAKAEFVPIIPVETARLLKNLMLIHAPKKILEIGTAIGYSGHIMLLNSPFSHLYTIELNEKSADIAAKYFKRSNIYGRVTLFRGDAGDIVPSLDGEFDFIFLDGPKAQYINYLPFLKKRLKTGGILLADNVLYSGMVAGEIKSGKKQGMVDKIDRFLSDVFSDGEFSASLLPLGDGLCMAIKQVSEVKEDLSK